MTYIVLSQPIEDYGGHLGFLLFPDGVLSGFLDNIVSYMYTKGISLPPKVDLFLGLRLSQEGTVVCLYYFADHVHHSVFWLDDLDARTLSILDVITTEPSHLAHAIEARYWSVLLACLLSFLMGG